MQHSQPHSASLQHKIPVDFSCCCWVLCQIPKQEDHRPHRLALTSFTCLGLMTPRKIDMRGLDPIRVRTDSARTEPGRKSSKFEEFDSVQFFWKVPLLIQNGTDLKGNGIVHFDKNDDNIWGKFKKAKGQTIPFPRMYNPPLLFNRQATKGSTSALFQSLSRMKQPRSVAMQDAFNLWAVPERESQKSKKSLRGIWRIRGLRTHVAALTLHIAHR